MMQNEQISLHDEISGETYHIDKKILCTFLPYFDTLFKSSMRDARSTSFNVPQLTYTTARSVSMLVKYSSMYATWGDRREFWGSLDPRKRHKEESWAPAEDVKDLLGLVELGDYYGIDLTSHADQIFRQTLDKVVCHGIRDTPAQVDQKRAETYSCFNYMRIRQRTLQNADRIPESMSLENVFWSALIDQPCRESPFLRFALDLPEDEHEEFWTACMQFANSEIGSWQPPEEPPYLTFRWDLFYAYTRIVMNHANSSKQPRNQELMKSVAALWNKRYFMLHSEDCSSLRASSEAQGYLGIAQIWMLFWHWSRCHEYTILRKSSAKEIEDFMTPKSTVIQNQTQILDAILATSDDDIQRQSFVQDFSNHLDLKCLGRAEMPQPPGESLKFGLKHCSMMRHLFHSPDFC